MCGEEKISCGGSCSSCKEAKASFCPEKREIRSDVRAFLDLMSEKTLSSASCAINKTLSSIMDKSSFTAVAAFVPAKKEPNVFSFLEKVLAEGKRLFLPRFRADGEYEMAEITSMNSLVKGQFGILEPASSAPVPEKEDVSKALWLVPGIAFDLSCARLGRGKGFYDRLLAKYAPETVTGVFFSCQRVAKVPSEPHDEKLDCVITEDAVFRNASYTKNHELF